MGLRPSLGRRTMWKSLGLPSSRFITVDLDTLTEKNSGLKMCNYEKITVVEKRYKNLNPISIKRAYQQKIQSSKCEFLILHANFWKFHIQCICSCSC
jgi:hypothetical protein